MKSKSLSKSIKSPLSSHHQKVWANFLEEERCTSNEGVYTLITHLELEDSTDLRRVRKKLRDRIKKGIDKQYLQEINLLYSYLQHLNKVL